MNELFRNLKNGTIRNLITHAGKFHADDVFSTALVSLVQPDYTLKRVPKVTDDMINDYTLIYDIGGKEYDHHQPNAEWRTEEEGGIKYAAFGLLWRELGADLLGSEDLAEKFDKDFVQIIDNTDNTGEPNMLSTQVSMFSPAWDEEQDFDTAFNKAVEWAREILARSINNMISTKRAEQYIINAVNDAHEEGHGNVIILDKFAPYAGTLAAINDTLADVDKVKFVVYPSIREKGAYNAMTVKESSASNIDLCPFPEEWAGKTDFSDTELTSLTFCHVARFIISGSDLTDVVAACEYAIEVQRELEV